MPSSSSTSMDHQDLDEFQIDQKDLLIVKDGKIKVAQPATDKAPQRYDSNGEIIKATGTWTKDEHDRFLKAMELYPKGPWKAIAAIVGTRTVRQTQTHAQKYREKIARRMRGLRNRNGTLQYPPTAPSMMGVAPVAVHHHAQHRFGSSPSSTTTTMGGGMTPYGSYPTHNSLATPQHGFYHAPMPRLPSMFPPHMHSMMHAHAHHPSGKPSPHEMHGSTVSSPSTPAPPGSSAGTSLASLLNAEPETAASYDTSAYHHRESTTSSYEDDGQQTTAYYAPPHDAYTNHGNLAAYVPSPDSVAMSATSLPAYNTIGSTWSCSNVQQPAEYTTTEHESSATTASSAETPGTSKVVPDFNESMDFFMHIYSSEPSVASHSSHDSSSSHTGSTYAHPHAS